MKTHKLKCGCRFEVGDRERWVEYCNDHRIDVEILHLRALTEHRSQMAAQHADYRPRIEEARA